MIRHLISMVALLALVASAQADNQVVTDFGDNFGPSQLRAKVVAARSSGGGTITFASGGNVVLAQGVLPAITANITVDGGGNVTIGGANTSRIFAVSPGATLTLMNLTLTKGFSANGDGGAIVSNGALDISNCKFIENQAADAFSGGAIVAYGVLKVTNSEFGANQAGNGGALYPRFAPAVTTITGCNFHDNSTTNTTDGLGGAMLIWDGAPVTVTDSTFSANIARQGGAIYVLANSSLTVTGSAFNGNMAKDAATADGGGIFNNGTLSVTQTVLSGNSATVGGGGIYNADASKMTTLTNVTLNRNSARLGGGYFNGNGKATLTNVTFNINTAANDGGGMYNGGIATTLTNTTFSGNMANAGGGLLNNGAVPMTNVTFSGNSASLAGGGIFNYSGSAWTLINVTISGNSAGSAGGIYHKSTNALTITLKNTIVASNSGGNCYQDNLSASNIASSGFNLSDDTTCGLTSTGDHQGPGFNPQLGQLQNNGGFTQTLLPGPGSPAIDNGTGIGAPATDQRGIMRPQFGAVDVGAVEVTRSDLPILANISTRLAVQTGDNALIGGFIITGTQPKKVIIRAIGPSLPFPGVLADPTLELYQGNTLLESNDNWVDSPNKQAIIDSTIPPSNNLESAIVRTLPANSTGYTAIVRGANNGTGIGVVEAYDLDRSVDSKLANISTRGLVQTGDNVLIAGTIILGQASQKVIIRAIGPSLSLPEKLADPTLQLVDGNGVVLEENDNWVDSPNKQAIIDSTIPPSNDKESAIVRTLPPFGDQYTAIVRGVNNTTGIAVVEIYALN